MRKTADNQPLQRDAADASPLSMPLARTDIQLHLQIEPNFDVRGELVLRMQHYLLRANNEAQRRPGRRRILGSFAKLFLKQISPLRVPRGRFGRNDSGALLSARLFGRNDG